MTNGPEAKIGEILTVPFPHPRNRQEIQHSPEYIDLRDRAIEFLERYH
jgi:nitrate/nitrite transport system ATP-binding protein